jgi:hypothetical protein
MGPTNYSSLFLVSLLTKQEKFLTSLPFLSSLSLSSLFLSNQTKAKERGRKLGREGLERNNNWKLGYRKAY